VPRQAPLRLIKTWRRYWLKDRVRDVPRGTRGFYVLYEEVRQKGRRLTSAKATYIGIAGKGGIRGRLESHVRHKRNWTHFSYFEVHDNISAEEIRELEALLLQVFRHDPRIRLSNVQTGSRKFYALRREHRGARRE
jgi:hypothetical protein